jgi:iron complex transport system ATP-binding protein
MSQLMQASNVSFAYTDRPVLREISIGLSAGEVVALLGPNGSGKTTLIHVLLGHLRGQGSIQWNDRELRQWRRRDLARQVAYLPQSPTIDPEHRVIDVLRLGRAPYWRAFGIESPQDAAVVEKISQMLDLKDLLNRRMDSLSGGQRQRVFVGRCLVQEPQAMLLDEPSTFLDLKAQIELCALLKKLAGEQKIGVLMASHDLNLSAIVAGRTVLLKQGAIVADGPPDQVFRAELLQDVYEVPIERVEIADGAPRVFPRLNP